MAKARKTAIQPDSVAVITVGVEDLGDHGEVQRGVAMFPRTATLEALLDYLGTFNNLRRLEIVCNANATRQMEEIANDEDIPF